MKSRLLILSVGLLAATAVPLTTTAQVSKSGSGYLLKMKWTKGRTYAYSIASTMSTQKQNGAYTVTVKDIKNGVATLDVTSNMPGVGKSTDTIQMDSSGKIISGGDGAMQTPAFPKKAVKVGESWKDTRKISAPFPITVNNTYVFKGIKTINKKQLAEIAMTTKGSGEQGMTVSGSGTMYLDLHEGMLHSSKTSVNVSIKTSQEKNAQPMKIAMNLNVVRTK